MMKYYKYILLLLLAISFMACENEALEDLRNRGVEDEPAALEEFNQGSANFTNYVALGNSLTAGFSDAALYKVSQENSMPAILAQQFAAVGNGGTFKQPLMNDNIGGLLAGGSPLPGFGPRLVLMVLALQLYRVLLALYNPQQMFSLIILQDHLIILVCQGRKVFTYLHQVMEILVAL